MHVNVKQRIVNLDDVEDVPCFLTSPELPHLLRGLFHAFSFRSIDSLSSLERAAEVGSLKLQESLSAPRSWLYQPFS